jgi:REP element-mobilizing transposase RayT
MWEGPLCPDSPMKENPHSRDLRLHRLSDAPATFFVTKSLLPKKQLLDSKLRQVIVDSFQYAVRRERIYLRAFVVMPSHWHASLMSHVAAETSSHLISQGSTWQDSYYETRIRTARQFRYVAYYIEQNPVKAELVDKPEDWEASSVARTDLVTDPWPWLFETEE